MNTLTRNSAPLSREAGVTLVELLVALVLGLVLTAGMIKVFTGNRVTYEFNQGLSRIQENARFALDHIAYYTRMAGYKGCISDIAVYNNLDTVDPLRDDIESGIQGFDADGTGDGEGTYTPAGDAAPGWTPALPADLTGEVLPGSDVLVVRGIAGGGISLVSPFTNAAQMFVSPAHDFEEGEILVVSDCQKASIFQVTNINATPNHNLVHSQDNSYSPGNAISNWPPEQDYGLGAEVARLQAYAFYVGAGTNGAPSLFQLRLRRDTASASSFEAEELVENVETLQVRYGVDADSDEAIDSWASADTVNAAGAWEDVLSVEITLLARAAEEYGAEVDDNTYAVGAVSFNPTDDRRLRQVFSTTIGVRNRLP